MKAKKLGEVVEDLIPQAEIIEADNYKRTYFGPDVPTLDLECWEDELSEYQLAAFKKADEEYQSIQTKLESIVKENKGEIVYNGDQFTAYQLLGKIPVLKELEKQSGEIIRSRSRSLSTAKEQTRTGKRGRPKKQLEDRDYSPDHDRSPSPGGRHKKKNKKDKEKDKPKDKSKDGKTKDKTLAPSNVHSVVTNIRPSEASAIGGLSTGGPAKTTAIVDLTKEDANSNKNVADSREVSFNKLQGKTFPSLVVVARPHLQSKDGSSVSDRSVLDAKVKAVLMHTPTKFTEWLIQQGLLRSEQWCAVHPTNKLKLGMYSDTTKFPFSGGYVWISECCPTRFVSVFCSSIFEGATHPPSILLKLIYHWACQTNVQNVVQWVKVDNLYVKGLFTWLRAVCTSAIHEHLGLIGGPGKKIQVGVISLGTTSHDGTQRQVKVEVLGVLDPVEKTIRLRAVEPLAEQEKNYKKRFQKILEPLHNWVHPSSTIVTDLTVDKHTLQSMGYKSVIQSSQNDNSKNSNANIMEYLRRIVPRMFQNTLSLLSRQIIQQFLDELVWREKFGITQGQAFDNIVFHIAEQTKLKSKDSITLRLNKIAFNPFKAWKYPKKGKDVEEEAPPPETKSKRGRKRKEATPPPPPAPSKRERKRKSKYVPDDDDDEELPLALRLTKVKQEKDKDKEKTKEKETETPVRGRRKRDMSSFVVDDETDDVPLKVIKKEKEAPKEEETVSMEKYYYGQVGGNGTYKKININVACPICSIELTNNCDVMRHIYGHLVPPVGVAGSNPEQCVFCTARFANEDDLNVHLKHTHPSDTKTKDLFTYACLICEVRFNAVLTLASHMQKAHSPLELPYSCQACDYRGSSHRRTVQHFYEKHSNDDVVQCPHCLTVFQIYVEGNDMASNMAVYLEHLKNHQDKLDMGCNKCILKFTNIGHLKEHQIREHCPVENAVPLCSDDHLITKPKNKPRHPIKDSAGHTISETFEEVNLCIPEGMLCRECDTGLDRERHFLGVTKCMKCPFVSSCYRSQLRHTQCCAGPHSLEDAPRNGPYESHCVCGYSTIVGTDMLTHLLDCDHKTAYSSEEQAKENIVGHTDNNKTTDEAQSNVETLPMADYAPPSVLNTQISLDDLAPPSVLQSDQQDQELRDSTYDKPLATPRHEDSHYSLGDFEPLPQEPTPQPDFEQL